MVVKYALSRLQVIIRVEAVQSRMLDTYGLGVAWLQDNSALVSWVQQQLRQHPLYCIGDGHLGQKC